MATAIVIDFAAAKRKILAKRAAAARALQPAYDPFEAPLLRAWAAKLDAGTLAVYRSAVSSGFARGMTTQQIAASVRRDTVRNAAKASL